MGHQDDKFSYSNLAIFEILYIILVDSFQSLVALLFYAFYCSNGPMITLE